MLRKWLVCVSYTKKHEFYTKKLDEVSYVSRLLIIYAKKYAQWLSRRNVNVSYV